MVDARFQVRWSAPSWLASSAPLRPGFGHLMHQQFPRVMAAWQSAKQPAQVVRLLSWLQLDRPPECVLQPHGERARLHWNCGLLAIEAGQ